MSEALGSWVPVPILVGVLGLAVGAIWLLFKSQFAQILARFDRLEKTVEGLTTQSHKVATVEQLGNMGNRMDDRIGDLRERMRVVESKQ